MRRILAAILVLGCATTSFAHYNMLLPHKPWAKKGEKVTFTYQFGHPFEHELFDAPEPSIVVVTLPDKTKQKVDKFTKVLLPGADGKKVVAYQFPYEPAIRGDHTVVLQAPPIWLEDAKEFVQDTVKVVLHVQTQKNWDAGLPNEFAGKANLAMTPHTRPYGLYPGMIFQARVAKPFTINTEAKFFLRPIEVEPYHAQPVKNPPPDELITFTTKTDTNGVFTFAFPEPGWWCMTSGWQEKDRTWKDGGKQGPLRERTTLWIHIDEKK